MPPQAPIYLDHQATTPCDPRVLDAMWPFFTERFGNAHSAEHAMGRDAGDAVEAARDAVAALIGAEAREIVFTSGATESNNLAIKGTTRHALRSGDSRRRLVTVATEHKCVLAAIMDAVAEGFDPVVLPVRSDGTLDPDRLRDALRTPTLLVSIMAANNETGVLHDLPGLAAIVHAAGAIMHSDGAQAVGRIGLAVGRDGIDLLSISGHKLHGPKGVGALRVRRRPRLRLEPLFSGGGQERGLRSGTLPTPLVVGLGEACRVALADMAEDATRIGGLRARLLTGLRQAVPGLVVHATGAPHLPGCLNVAFPVAPAAALIAACPDLCLSTGSACSSAEIEPSYVLRAMGVPDSLARRSLRLGLGRFTSAAEVDHAVWALGTAHASLASVRDASKIEA